MTPDIVRKGMEDYANDEAMTILANAENTSFSVAVYEDCQNLIN